MATGTTAIRAPSPSIDNHQIVLGQLKEIAEVAQRQRGSPMNSFVTLGELVSAGVVNYRGTTVSPGKTSTSSTTTVATKAGPAGPTGATGSVGVEGPQGNVGATGATGDTGASASLVSWAAQVSALVSLRI
jgi:hypothetical protein